MLLIHHIIDAFIGIHSTLEYLTFHTEGDGDSLFTDITYCKFTEGAFLLRLMVSGPAIFYSVGIYVLQWLLFSFSLTLLLTAGE